MEPQEILNYAAIGLGVASTFVPIARLVARLTASKTDDALVETVAQGIHDLLGYIPTISIRPVPPQTPKQEQDTKSDL